MGDHDDISHYAPLVRRIIILVAVVTAVPVMMWTATAFMHRYVMPPDLPWLHPKLAQPAAAGSDKVATAVTPPPAPSPVPAAAPVIEASAAPTNMRGIDIPPKVQPASDSNAAAPPPAAAEPAAPAPAASSAPPAAAATYTIASASASAVSPAPAAASEDITASLPAAERLAEPVPLPRHRPSAFALAETGGVPLPRARPGNSAETTPASAENPSGYDAGMAHY
jgi:hypothetical protein